ncbi:MAG: cation transporter [Acidobacteria bacterium]|nr:cation transporter [Acidobacteriota bacterium]
MNRLSLRRYAWLSIATAIATILLKSFAYWLTGSVGLLSDAIESLVNLAGALTALAMLTIAARPASDEHPYGYSKAEYFSSGVEGTLIFIAALSILVAASGRLIYPRVIEQTGAGLIVSFIASVINFVVARILLEVGKAANSITLEADAHHLMTDVWTSAGVIVGVGLVSVTGWQRLDPIIAIAVALNIIWTGFHLMRRSVWGLMDRALPKAEREVVLEIFERYKAQGVEYHALRTRQAGARRFVAVHVLVPGAWSVQRGHQLLEEIEQEIRSALPDVSVLTHLEPVEDPASWDDLELDR